MVMPWTTGVEGAYSARYFTCHVNEFARKRTISNAYEPNTDVGVYHYYLNQLLPQHKGGQTLHVNRHVVIYLPWRRKSFTRLNERYHHFQLRIQSAY